MEVKKINADIFNAEPDRFALVDGQHEGAPKCRYGNVQPLVGYDKTTQQYVRYTQSVYKRMKQKLEIR